LQLLGGASHLKVFSREQLEAMALLSPMLFPSVLVPAFIGELSFAGWLTVKGVNVARWQEMAERSRS
jgi:hypothetical protein